MTISEKIKQIIADQVAIDVKLVTDDKSLDEFGFDSLDAIDLYAEIENVYNLYVPIEVENPETIVSYIIKYYTKLIEAEK